MVVDYFTIGSHFGALSSTYTTHKVALLFMDIVSKLYGFPISLVSNCNLIFISSFWRELFRICGTKLRMSTLYTQKPTARPRYSTKSSNNISEHSFTISNQVVLLSFPHGMVLQHCCPHHHRCVIISSHLWQGPYFHTSVFGVFFPG